MGITDDLYRLDLLKNIGPGFILLALLAWALHAILQFQVSADWLKLETLGIAVVLAYIGGFIVQQTGVVLLRPPQARKGKRLANAASSEYYFTRVLRADNRMIPEEFKRRIIERFNAENKVQLVYDAVAAPDNEGMRAFVFHVVQEQVAMRIKNPSPVRNQDRYELFRALYVCSILALGVAGFVALMISWYALALSGFKPVDGLTLLASNVPSLVVALVIIAGGLKFLEFLRKSLEPMAIRYAVSVYESFVAMPPANASEA